MNYVFTVVLSLLIGIAVGGCIEELLNSDRLRSEAVERGVAEWIVNQKNGTTTWKWKEPKP